MSEFGKLTPVGGEDSKEPPWLRELLDKYGERSSKVGSVGYVSQNSPRGLETKAKIIEFWEKHSEIPDDLRKEYPNPGKYYGEQLLVAREKGIFEKYDAIEFALRYSHVRVESIKKF